jgi:hypothetical protein
VETKRSGRSLRIIPNPAEAPTKFRFRLEGIPATTTEAVEFDLTVADAMRLMRALQMLQVRHKLPLPQDLRPTARPHLRLVPPDDGEQ